MAENRPKNGQKISGQTAFRYPVSTTRMADSDLCPRSHEFIRFGAMDVTKPCEFIGFGAMDVTKPYEFIGFGAF